MAYIVGTDEAGYGPNLGPLVVSASAWEVSDDLEDGDAIDLYRSLAGAITRDTAANKLGEGNLGDGKLVIADSKCLHSPGHGLAPLERGVLAMLAVAQRRPRTWREAWYALEAASPDVLASVPWHADFDEPLPIDANLEEMEGAAARVASGLDQANVRFITLRSRAVFPDQWNALNARAASKGAVLSHITLDLAAELLAELPAARTWLVCDKHGGRSRYADLLYGRLTDAWIEVREEGLEQSIYRWEANGRRVEVRFCARGESHLPVALASMTSKYLRELSMRAFNAWWQDRVPGLKPTAGYPVDARRFRHDIAEHQRALGVDDRVLWRDK